MNPNLLIALLVATVPNLVAVTVLITTLRNNQRTIAHATKQNAQSLTTLTEIVADHNARLRVLEDRSNREDREAAAR